MGLTCYESGRIIGALFWIRGPSYSEAVPAAAMVTDGRRCRRRPVLRAEPAYRNCGHHLCALSYRYSRRRDVIHAGTPTGQYNLAPSWLLMALPGIGETRAQAIVDYREHEGPFQRVDQLLQVPDIGPATYQGLRGLVTVGELP